MKKSIVFPQPSLTIPTQFNNCWTPEKQIIWLYKKCVELEERIEKLEKKA